MYSSKKDIHLYDWCRRQRNERKLNRIDNEPIKLLDELNFRWVIPNDDWETKYNEFISCIHKRNTTRIPESENTIYQWIIRQLKDCEDRKLSSDKIKKLNKVGFIWDAVEYRWQQKYEEMKIYLLRPKELRLL